MARFGRQKNAESSDTPRSAVPFSDPDLDDVVITEEELTQIRLGDIAFGDASDLGFDT